MSRMSTAACTDVNMFHNLMLLEFFRVRACVHLSLSLHVMKLAQGSSMLLSHKCIEACMCRQ